MRRKIQKMRSSLMIVIPAETAKDMGLKVGDLLDFCIENGKIIMKPVPTPSKDQAQVLKNTPHKEMIYNEKDNSRE